MFHWACFIALFIPTEAVFISPLFFKELSKMSWFINNYYFLLATVKNPLVQEDWHYFWDTILVAWTLQWCAWISALLCTFVGSWRCRPVHKKVTIVGFLELYLFCAQAEATGAYKCAQERWDLTTPLQCAVNRNCSGVPESQCSCCCRPVHRKRYRSVEFVFWSYKFGRKLGAHKFVPARACAT